MNAKQFVVENVPVDRLYVDTIQMMTIDEVAEMLDKYLESKINTPEVNDFIIGICNEVVHQQHRWPSDPKQLPHHFILVVAKILGKMSMDVFDRDKEKLKHHVIALAAEMCNFHRLLMDDSTYSAAYFDSLSSTLDDSKV